MILYPTAQFAAVWPESPLYRLIEVIRIEIGRNRAARKYDSIPRRYQADEKKAS